MAKPFSVKMRGVGPVYVAVERKCTERSHISRAWIREVAKPYRTGHGWRVRLGHFAVQFGTCTKNPEVGEQEDTFMAHLQMRWLPYLGEYEDDAPDQDGDEGSGDDEVWTGEPVDVQRDGLVEGCDLPDLCSHGVGRCTTCRAEDGGQEGPEAAHRAGS